MHKLNTGMIFASFKCTASSYVVVSLHALHCRHVEIFSGSVGTGTDGETKVVNSSCVNLCFLSHSNLMFLLNFFVGNNENKKAMYERNVLLFNTLSKRHYRSTQKEIMNLDYISQ